MRRVAPALLAAATLVLGSATVAGASPEPALFPLTDGKRWVLYDEHGAELRITVRRSGAAYVLTGFPGLGATRVRARQGTIEAWDDTSSRWEPFFRLAAPAGTHYTVDLGGSSLWRRVDVRIASRTASCVNALGRPVRGCVRLVLTSRFPVADAGVERLVFAPGLGPAEIVEQTIAGPRRFGLSPATTS